MPSRFAIAVTSCACLLTFGMADSAHATLYQNLTAADPASITKNASHVVNAWADQSGNNRNASMGAGSVIHPATNLFSAGKTGLDFGNARNSLQLLNLANTKSLLDFNGTAAGNTGFSMLISVRVDQLDTDWSDLLGVTSATTGGFGLRYNNAGTIQTYMGGVTVLRPAADRKVAAGDSVVFAVNYDAASGKLTLWDSLNNSERSTTVAMGDFSGNSKTLLLGSMDNASRHTTGSVGEVRIHNAALSPTEFSNARIAMTDRWVRRAIQHLDATIPESVIGNPVTQWTDQTGKGNHASASTGSVSYPSTHLYPTGKAGMQFGPPSKSLQLLSEANTANLLDFNGPAATQSGFSVFLTVRVDQLNPNAEPNDLIGVTSFNNAGGFGLRLNTVGRIVTYMGGSTILRPDADRKLTAGSTAIIALNYHAATGVLTLWDSLNDTEITATIPKGNFAGSNLPLKLGSLDNPARHLLGSVGEVKLFSETLSASDFAAQRDAMSLKWLGERPTYPVMPVKPVFTVAQLLNWDPATDADAPFNVATVPLRSRVNVPSGLKANHNSRVNQGGVQALDTYFGNRPQGGSGSIYTFTYWQYLEEAVYWGGISSINIVPPTGEMIDNAHRNGVPILGTIFFPPLVYGGNYSWVQAFLTKSGNTYPAADKLIEMAEYYGFDGWFINQETEGGTAADAAAMRDLIRHIRVNSHLKITWYDSMTESGNIQWQDVFNTNNDWYMRHNYTTGQQNSSGALIADSIFIDFFNDSSTFLTSSSRSHAQTLGLDAYKVWTGLEAEAEDFRSSTAARIKMAKIFPDGANHITSVGFYKPSKYATQLPDQDLFWTGASGDPSNTSATVGTGAWKGVAHNIAERSAINTMPFATHFCIGRGSNYSNHGEIVKPGAWWNRALQSILPTWRWIVTTTGTKLTPELWSGDSYRGGGCLRVSGTLDATNTVRLFLTELPATANTRLKITYKREGLSGVDSLMQVGVGTLGSPFTFYPVGACAIDGWNQATINLSAHAGNNLTALALRFASGTPVDSYEIRIGEIVVYDETSAAPEPPTNIQPLDVVGWNGLVSGRVKWDHAVGGHEFYHVFVRLTDGSLVSVGSTPSNYFYFDSIPISGEYSAVVVQTIGADTQESRFSDVGNYQTWATSQGIPGEPPGGDFDQDGISNLMEYALGLDPKVADPAPGSLVGNTITFTKGTEAIANGDVSWVIESSPTLTPDSWNPQVSQAAGHPAATISHTFAPGALPQNFFRLRVIIEP